MHVILRRDGMPVILLALFVPNLFFLLFSFQIYFVFALFSFQIYFREGVIEIDNDPFFGNAPKSKRQLPWCEIIFLNLYSKIFKCRKKFFYLG
jgi:hypothetical protein